MIKKNHVQSHWWGPCTQYVHSTVSGRYTDKMSNDKTANDKTATDKISKDKTANDKMSNATK